jgi:hypothetical protein
LKKENLFYIFYIDKIKKGRCNEMKVFSAGVGLLVVATIILPRCLNIAMIIATTGAVLAVLGFILVTTYKGGGNNEIRR